MVHRNFERTNRVVLMTENEQLVSIKPIAVGIWKIFMFATINVMFLELYRMRSAPGSWDYVKLRHTVAIITPKSIWGQSIPVTSTTHWTTPQSSIVTRILLKGLLSRRMEVKIRCLTMKIWVNWDLVLDGMFFMCKWTMCFPYVYNVSYPWSNWRLCIYPWHV